MDARLRIILAGFVTVNIALWWAAGHRTAAVELSAKALQSPEIIAAPQSASLPTVTGVASCAAASCHGGPKANQYSVSSFSYTAWADGDKHARAFDVLFDARSVRMAKLLGLGEPHQERRCLNCHSMQGSCEQTLPESVLADGVGCEVCHGNASKWRTIHYLPEWQTLSKAERSEKFGYEDLSTPMARGKKCVACHVGAEGRDVDHDLIAAGHPRLMFELAAYQRLQPIHWNTRGKAESHPDFSERSWSVGQALSIAAAARLLSHRTEVADAAEQQGAPSHWPELAEFDCYACHHDLQTDRVQRSLGGSQRIGAPRWGSWELAGASVLFDGQLGFVSSNGSSRLSTAISDLSTTAEESFFAPDKLPAMRQAADQVAVRADEWANFLSNESKVSTPSPGRVIATLVDDPKIVHNWDQAAQLFLALTALDQSAERSSRRRDIDTGLLTDLRQQLRFSTDADSPESFRVDTFRRLLEQFRATDQAGESLPEPKE
jgi:hypothetical protein